jgi:hypothetical protein
MALSDSISGLGNATGLFSGAAGDLLSASGMRTARDSYFKSAETTRLAAKAATANADIEREAVKLRLQGNEIKQQSNATEFAANANEGALANIQLGRQIFKVTGGQRADVAAAGLSASGSALDVMRESASQGAFELQAQDRVTGTTGMTIKQQGRLILTERDLINRQGEIDVNAYVTQAAALEAQADAYVAQGRQAESTAKAQEASAAGKSVGGILGVIGSVIKIFGF